MAINRRGRAHSQAHYVFLKADVKKAHRRERIRKEDRKYMVSKLGPDEYYA